MIKNSCNKVKQCAKCRDNIYTFEMRKNLNNGRVEHLKGQCKPVSERVDDIVLSDDKKLLAFIGLVLCIIILLLGVHDG